MLLENRRYPRVEVKWPVMVMSLSGPVGGETLNVSVDGALIRSLEVPKIGDGFRLIIKPDKRRFFVTVAELVWSDLVRTDEFSFHGLGIHFKRILDDDRAFLRSVTPYYR